MGDEFRGEDLSLPGADLQQPRASIDPTICRGKDETWRQVSVQDDLVSTVSKATSLMTSLLNWKFNMNVFESSFNDFEKMVELYDREQSKPFPDEVKKCIVWARTKGPLRDYLLVNTDLSMSWQTVRTTVDKWIVKYPRV